MEVLSYQPHFRKHSSLPRGWPLSISNLRTPSSSNPTSRRSFVSSQNQPSADGVNEDESSDDELPSLKKLLSPTTSRLYSLNPSVQTDSSSGLTSTPRRRLFNPPKWSSCQYLPTQAPNPTIQAEANNENKNPIAIDDNDDDDDDGDPTDLFDHSSHRMTVNDSEMVGENTYGHAGCVVAAAARTGVGMADSDPEDAAMSQGDDRLEIARSVSSLEIPESDSAATLDEERQLGPFRQGDSILGPCGRRGHGLNGSSRTDGRAGDWVFDFFAEDDSGTEGGGLPPLKRVRSSPFPLTAVEDRSSPAAAVAADGIEVSESVHGSRSPRGDKEYNVRQIVGESELEYEVTAVTKIWLPKASVDRKLVRKYRAEQRAATRFRTRWSSRLRNKS